MLSARSRAYMDLREGTCDDDKRHVGAHHEDFRVGQIHHAHHTKDEAKAQGHDCVGAADHEPIDELLEELFHT
jgi:hypothetical protein